MSIKTDTEQHLKDAIRPFLDANATIIVEADHEGVLLQLSIVKHGRRLDIYGDAWTWDVR